MFTPHRIIAGMPNIELSEIGKLRCDSISFFLLIFLVSAAGVRWLWNRLTLDFPQLPKITYKTAISATFLWGLLFLFVLTMTSGVRELLTPGAWKKSGVTYTLNDPQASSPSGAMQHERRWQLEVLRSLLWTYAASHNSVNSDSWRNGQSIWGLRFQPNGFGDQWTGNSIGGTEILNDPWQLSQHHRLNTQSSIGYGTTTAPRSKCDSFVRIASIRLRECYP